jgi:hypothetical protein
VPRFILVSVRETEQVDRPRHFAWDLWLESMDGATVIPLTHQHSIGQVLLQPGFQGLGVPPVDLAIGGTPGVDGGYIEDVSTLSRPVILPLKIWGRTDAEKWSAVQALRDLTDPTVGMTPDGNYKLVSDTPTGKRELTLAYRGGLEGDMRGNAAPERIVLDSIAVDPFAREREERVLPFPLIAGGVFLTRNAGTDHPWGTRKLSPSTVIGTDMHVVMPSAVPVSPTISITGPAPDGATVIADSGLRLIVTGAIPAGKTLRVVTDRRARSARLDGAPAWGMISRASRFVPFNKGEQVLDVTVPGASSSTMLRLGWRGGHRSMW